VCSPPPEAGGTRRSGLLALLCGIGSLVAFFSEHFGGFLPLLTRRSCLASWGLSSASPASLSRGERRSGAIGLVAAVVGIALPVLFLIALIVAFSQAE
jgi:hypothetical protein